MWQNVFLYHSQGPGITHVEFSLKRNPYCVRFITELRFIVNAVKTGTWQSETILLYYPCFQMGIMFVSFLKVVPLLTFWEFHTMNFDHIYTILQLLPFPASPPSFQKSRNFVLFLCFFFFFLPPSLPFCFLPSSLLLFSLSFLHSISTTIRAVCVAQLLLGSVPCSGV